MARTLRELLKVLEKAYGKVNVLPDEPPLDHAVYLILREGWDYRKAARALHLLQSEFVDWNEVRVTTAGELLGLLAPLGGRDLEVKIEKIKTLLDNVFREYNRVTFDFLLEMDPEAQARLLSSMGVLTPAQVQVLVQALARDELQVPQQAIRVLNRVGIMPRVYSTAAARKHLARALEESDWYDFQSHLVQHGEEICLLKSPRCGECPVVALCGFKRKVGVVGKS